MGTDAKVVVRLSVEERVLLDAILQQPRVAKDRVLRIRMLLKADADGFAWSDPQIADAFDVSPITVARLRHRCVFEGLEAAISRRPPTGTKPRTLDGAAEARLVAIACSSAPEGSAKWTMRMLADKLVELKIVDEVSDETVRKTLKKSNSSRGEKRSGSFRPRPTPTSSVRCRVRLAVQDEP